MQRGLVGSEMCIRDRSTWGNIIMTSPYKSALEEERKDIIIRQLERENNELRQKERDYYILNSQLVDLEHRFRMLQEEKLRAQKDTIEKQDMLVSESSPVSYTHLTLPTILLVQISVVAVSFKKKKIQTSKMQEDVNNIGNYKLD
eukprot:TRINITY_DN45756_c0_g1_i2.p1 TRINITY_DN45756_c0_g1~~TRINITY_DN45756_c0_g1_i2.p1  ORF type:complete len:145 (+),score=49.95 TRINITY_DN45756_c0_g1_i2:132-566(+)